MYFKRLLQNNTLHVYADQSINAALETFNIIHNM